MRGDWKDRVQSVGRSQDRQFHALWMTAHLTCVLALWVPAAAYAQAPALVAGVDADATQGQHPFLLPQQPPEISEAIEDFRRFAGRKQWEIGRAHV